MNKPIILVLLTGLTNISCHPQKARVNLRGTLPITETDSDTYADLSIDSLKIRGPTYRPCELKMTYTGAILELNMPSGKDIHYDNEITSVLGLFFFPGERYHKY